MMYDININVIIQGGYKKMFLDNGMNRIVITQKLRDFIIKEREKKGFSATKLASEMKRPQSWLAQIENGRTQTIKSKDLVSIFSTMLNVSMEQADEYLFDNIDEFTDSLVNSNEEFISKQKIMNIKQYLNFTDTETENEYKKQKKFIVNTLNEFYNIFPEDTVKILRTFCANLNFNFSFMMGIISIPFAVLKDADEIYCKELYEKISELFLEYANKDKHRVSLKKHKTNKLDDIESEELDQ